MINLINISKWILFVTLFSSLQFTNSIDEYMSNPDISITGGVILLHIFGILLYPITVFNGNKKWFIYILHIFRPRLEFVDLHIHNSVYYTLARRNKENRLEAYMNYCEKYGKGQLYVDGTICQIGKTRIGWWLPTTKDKRTYIKI